MVLSISPVLLSYDAMNRKKIAAANWKMNLSQDEGDQLIQDIIAGIPGNLACEVVIAPPAIYLTQMIKQLEGTDLQPAAQNCHPEVSGAFTGEISAAMFSRIGVKYCLVGHSERRQLFDESNQFIREKVDAILENQMIPVFCCGESLALRQRNEQNDFVRLQLEESLFHLEEEQIRKVVVAYEPIWAIGTGVTASPEQAQEMHAFIRLMLTGRYGQTTSDTIRILYGGSIKSDNASILFSQPDVDGGLVGGASLNASSFLSIIEAANT